MTRHLFQPTICFHIIRTLLSQWVLRCFMIGLVPLAFCSCAATSVKHTWKSPEFQGPAITKLASLVIDDRKMLRQGFENRFVTQLKGKGVTAIPTYELLSLGEIKEDKPAA